MDQGPSALAGGRQAIQDWIRDPRAFRWVESGVSGLARAREWDTTAVLELPSLVGAPIATFEATVYPDRVDGDLSLTAAAIESIRTEIERTLQPPYALRAVRHDERTWTVGARVIRSTLISLRVSALCLEIACPPGEDRSIMVDGEFVTEPFDQDLAEAVRQLEQLGQERFESFVARADKVEADRWELTIDPL